MLAQTRLSTKSAKNLTKLSKLRPNVENQKDKVSIGSPTLIRAFLSHRVWVIETFGYKLLFCFLMFGVVDFIQS